jgi:hypothetical protein
MLLRVIILAVLVFAGVGAVFSYFSHEPYTPQEVTEDQAIPLILQGGTDWGGSNFFAAYVTTLIVFGFLGAYVFTGQLHFRRPWQSDLMAVFWWSLLIFNLLLISPYFVAAALYPKKFCEPDSLYFLSEDLGTTGLFVFFYVLTAAWILWLRRFPLGLRYLLAPAILVLLLALGADGITAKSGQVVTAGQIPPPNLRSWKHRLMLLPQETIWTVTDVICHRM